MLAIRRLASRLLSAVVRHSSSESHEWASAMLGELDFIESDWAALFWALGSTGAILRYFALRGLRGWFDKRAKQQEGLMLKHIRRHAAGTLSGVLIAVGVLFAGFGVVRLLLALFPASDAKQKGNGSRNCAVGGRSGRTRCSSSHYPLRSSKCSNFRNHIQT